MPNISAAPWVVVPPGTPQKRCTSCGTLVYVVPDRMRGAYELVVCGVPRGVHADHGVEERHPDATVAAVGQHGRGISHYTTCPDAAV